MDFFWNNIWYFFVFTLALVALSTKLKINWIKFLIYVWAQGVFILWLLLFLVIKINLKPEESFMATGGVACFGFLLIAAYIKFFTTSKKALMYSFIISGLTLGIFLITMGKINGS